MVEQRTVAIGSDSGLHARPAAMFVQAAAKQPVKVTIAKAARRPGAGAQHPVGAGPRRPRGDEVVLVAEGDGADQALDELAALVARDLDSEE